MRGGFPRGTGNHVERPRPLPDQPQGHPSPPVSCRVRARHTSKTQRREKQRGRFYLRETLDRTCAHDACPLVTSRLGQCVWGRPGETRARAWRGRWTW